MEKIKIAIQGELGAYSHIAANNLFKDAEIKTCKTFEETFKQAYEDESYKIIIPIEKKTIGSFSENTIIDKYATTQINWNHQNSDRLALPSTTKYFLKQVDTDSPKVIY